MVANQDDVKSLEQAFHGAYGVFAVTNFWETQYGLASSLVWCVLL